MSSVKKYMVLALAIIALSSCANLDYDETSGKTTQVVFDYYENQKGAVSHIYSFLPKDFGVVSDAMMESATDNSVYTWEQNDITSLTNGKWSSVEQVDNAWGLWGAIRSANLFLENFNIDALDKYKYNANFDEIMAKTLIFPYEVRFLRAFYFFELAKRYGDIPLITRSFEVNEINSISQDSFADVTQFIVDECDSVALQLPVDHNNYWGETGRATRGAALALKSRALLYAASLWHNPENLKTKWEKAAKAASEIIRTGPYVLPKNSLDPLYDSKGGNTVLSSTQLIFERRDASKTNTFEARNQPMGYEGAKGGNTPTQNLVDAYEMLNGETFDWNNPNHVNNMYYDNSGKPTRDPRLYRNVLMNGSSWLSKVVDVTEGGANKILAGSTKTGYYLRKYMNPSVSLDPVKPNLIEHHYILFRYAEILLNYAEAMNEWVGPDAVNVDCPLSARAALNLIRTSATMPAITETGDAFTKKLRNERRIELAFEGHRFWDIRRWKIAGSDEVRKVYGITITKENNVFTFEKKLVQDRFWDDKMYLFPIPQSEIYLNTKLVQNKGW